MHGMCTNCPDNILEEHFSIQNSIRTHCKRVLVIDDDPVLVNLMGEMLDILGYQPMSATSSAEAFKIFCAAPNDFDLVITDMSMPGMNGDKLAGRIISIRKNIPIILCTGFNENISAAEAKSIGISEIVLKPVNMKTLSNAVIKAIMGRQA